MELLVLDMDLVLCFCSLTGQMVLTVDVFDGFGVYVV